MNTPQFCKVGRVSSRGKSREEALNSKGSYAEMSKTFRSNKEETNLKEAV